VGVKDAKGDLAATSAVLSRSDLAYYSGDDPMNLPLWSIGAVGCISVTGHVVGDRIHAMLEAFTAGRNAEAAKLHRSMLPVNVGLFRNQAAVMTKAALELLGQPGGGVRAPLLPANDAERHTLIQDLIAGGVKLNYLHSDLPSGNLASPKHPNEDDLGDNAANGAAR
jgi:4-hydroxy-tetrahydrodipicolinate synthase